MIERMRLMNNGGPRLAGTGFVEMVPVPPFGVAYRIFSIMGLNYAGATRQVTVYFNKNGTRTRIAHDTVVSGGSWFKPPRYAGGQWNRPSPFNIVLSDTDESLDMSSDASNTSRIYVAWEVIEAAP